MRSSWRADRDEPYASGRPVRGVLARAPARRATGSAYALVVTLLRGELRAAAKALLPAASRYVWRRPLDRAATLDVLEGALVQRVDHEPVAVPAVPGVSGRNAPHLPGRKLRFDPDHVWDLRVGDHVRSLHVCRSGTVLIDGRLLLNLDFGASPGLLESPLRPGRVTYETVVAPWSHFYGTYHDFVIFVLTKLCRIEAHFGRDIWRRATVCYPLFRTAYERECFAHLGVPAERVVDTRSWRRDVRARRVLLANNQPWFTPSPRDLALLRARFHAPGADEPRRRLYVSRSGRRRVTNEAAVRDLLRVYDFEFVEDRPRSVAEQIRLFQRASAVVGPHGAGLTNMLWCDSGTPVLELFHGRYMPPYFRHLSGILGHSYGYLTDGHGVLASPSAMDVPRSGEQRRPVPDDDPWSEHPAGQGLPAALLARSAEDMTVDLDALRHAVEGLP